jgi:hypothetical protein
MWVVTSFSVSAHSSPVIAVRIVRSASPKSRLSGSESHLSRSAVESMPIPNERTTGVSS